MPTFSERVDDFVVSIECRAELEPHARFVLGLLSTPGVQLRDGVGMGMGWSMLFIRRDPEDRKSVV